MKITSDWHIHSRNSCDSACMTIPELVRGAEEKGIRDFGLTDHLHTPYNITDISKSYTEFIAVNPCPHFHLGIEVSCVSQWELDEIAAGKHESPVYGIRSGGPVNCALAIGMSSADIKKYDIEYVVGGVHWPMYVPIERKSVIRDYHRQNMFLATHPLVNIVAHPWWWMGHWKDTKGIYQGKPWFDDFNNIPKSMHDEFAAAAVENDTVVEINISANLLNPEYPKRFVTQYLEYLAFLKSQGVSLSIGSDCHSAHYDIDFDTVAQMLDSAGIKEKDLWLLPPRSSHLQ